MTQLTAEAHIRETGKLAATAASVHLNVDTSKEMSDGAEDERNKSVKKRINNVEYS